MSLRAKINNKKRKLLHKLAEQMGMVVMHKDTVNIAFQAMSEREHDAFERVSSEILQDWCAGKYADNREVLLATWESAMLWERVNCFKENQ